MKVSQLFIYPVKSLGGIEVSSAKVTDRGFEYDRRWMLVDDANRFMTQRQIPALALLQVSLSDKGLLITHKISRDAIMIPFEATGEEVQVLVWNDTCRAFRINVKLDEWFSRQLGLSCHLVYMPETTHRLVDRNYAKQNEITSFSDAYPFLIIGQSSLDDLNARLKTGLPMNRFRPNIVFTGGLPYEEDDLTEFTISEIRFFGVKPCARCTVTTVNQDTAEKGMEPLTTLSQYRLKHNNVYFGQNLLHLGAGNIRIGDKIQVVKKAPLPFL